MLKEKQCTEQESEQMVDHRCTSAELLKHHLCITSRRIAESPGAAGRAAKQQHSLGFAGRRKFRRVALLSLLGSPLLGTTCTLFQADS